MINILENPTLIWCTLLLILSFCFLKKKQAKDETHLRQEVARLKSLHQETNARFKKNKNQLEAFINALPPQLIVINETGIITHWNINAAQEFHISKSEAIGKNIFRLLPGMGITEKLIKKVIQQNKMEQLENITQQIANKTQYLDINLCPIRMENFTGVIIQIENVTFKVNLEHLMIQNEKMLSIGELASGMAHEINNPLSVILQGAQNILRRCSVDIERNHKIAAKSGINLNAVNDYLKEREIFRFIFSIQEAGEQASNIITNMLEFSRNTPQVKQKVNVTHLITQSLSLALKNSEIQSLIQLKNIEFKKEFQNELPEVNCNASEIQQVLFNLIKNAVHAISENPPHIQKYGKILLKVFQKSNLLEIEIQDNGCGMEPSTINRIFEPFFTTKRPGDGTGLGLAVTYFIITEHHSGTIDVSSKRGEGSIFTIRLPMLNQITNPFNPLPSAKKTSKHVGLVDIEKEVAH